MLLKGLRWALLLITLPPVIVVTLFGGHWCIDETLALLASLPFLSYGAVWLRTRLGRPAPSCDCGHPHEHEHVAEEVPERPV
jgi:hypothetical protein